MSTLTLPSRQTAPEACADLLRQEIIAGRWSPGERLPPERELAQQLGLTRVTLRSAIAALSAEGLVESRQGSGTRVLDYRLGGGPGLLPALAQDALRSGTLSTVVADMLALRRGLAREVLARLATRPPGPEALAAFGVAVEAFAALATSSAPTPEALAQADLAVVRALVSATGSAVFLLGLNPIAEALATLPVLAEAIYRAPQENLLGWQALAAWLAAPDPAQLPAFVALLEERDHQTLAALQDPSHG